MGVGAVWNIGTVPGAPYIASPGTHPRGITHVTLGLGAGYVFQDGLGSFVTRVSIIQLWLHVLCFSEESWFCQLAKIFSQRVPRNSKICLPAWTALSM